MGFKVRSEVPEGLGAVQAGRIDVQEPSEFRQELPGVCGPVASHQFVHPVDPILRCALEVVGRLRLGPGGLDCLGARAGVLGGTMDDLHPYW